MPVDWCCICLIISKAVRDVDKTDYGVSSARLSTNDIQIDNTLLGYYHSKSMQYNKSSVAHRLKIIAGQVNGLARMLEEEKYCMDVLAQSLAIQKALKEIDRIILEGHLKKCVVEQIKGNEEKRAVDELVKIYSLSRKG